MCSEVPLGTATAMLQFGIGFGGSSTGGGTWYI